MSVDSATQDPHKGGRKTPGTLGVGLVASFLYPVLYYYLVRLLRIEDPATGYVLTILSSVFLGALALWALKREGFRLDDIRVGPQGLREASLFVAAIWLAMGLMYYALAGEAVLDHVSPTLILIQQWIFAGIAGELLLRGYLLSRLARMAYSGARVSGDIPARHDVEPRPGVCPRRILRLCVCALRQCDLHGVGPWKLERSDHRGQG